MCRASSSSASPVGLGACSASYWHLRELSTSTQMRAWKIEQEYWQISSGYACPAVSGFTADETAAVPLHLPVYTAVVLTRCCEAIQGCQPYAYVMQL